MVAAVAKVLDLVRLPFSPKLRLAVLWPAGAALLVTVLVLAQALPRQVTRQAGRDLLAIGHLVEPQVRRWHAEGLASLAAGLETIGRRGDLRLTVIGRDGSVLADSAPPPGGVDLMDNHATRPEVEQALRSGSGTSVRRSDTTGQDYAYAAWTMALERGDLVVLRLARPLPALAAMRRGLYSTIALAALAAAAVVAAIWWWLHRTLFRPLARLIAGANRMARGDGGQLPIPEAEELATFSSAVNRLAARVQEQVGALERQRDRLEAILASLPDGVLVTDRDGRSVSVNPTFRHLFGLEDRPIEGRSPAELVRQPQLARLVGDTLRSGEPGRSEIERVVGSAERRTLSLQSSALRAPGSDPTGAIVVVRDTTAIERLSEVRRDFVANVSHELKTPLAAIRAYAETLRDGALDDPTSAPRFIERVLAQCRRLQALLDDLLTLSRLEAIGERVERQPVDIVALVRRAVEVAATATREKGVEVTVETQPVPELEGDADALERLVVNLLDNAIKYNRPGGRVGLRLRRLAAAPGEREAVEIEITDSGIGIPADALPRIFERFYRVDKARSREEGGTGLGLAIVKHVAQAHGGRVEVQSDVGRGSRFRVRLPV